MKRLFLFILLIMIINNLLASTITIKDPCSNKPLFEGEVIHSNTDVAKITLDFFTKNNIDYIGNKSHIYSIANIPHLDLDNVKGTQVLDQNNIYTKNPDINYYLRTPFLGEDIYEIINDYEMYVYGWCYKVNNKLSPTVATGFKLKEEDNVKIEWFYGYIHYDKNNWGSFCKEDRAPKALCSQN